jgi:hypothetical protein
METNCNNRNAYNNENNSNYVRNGNCCNCDNHSQRIWNADIVETDYDDSPFFSFLALNTQLPNVSNNSNKITKQKSIMTAGKTQNYNKIKQAHNSHCDIPDDLFEYCKYNKIQSGGHDDGNMINNIGELMSNIGIGIAAIIVVCCVSYMLK